MARANPHKGHAHRKNGAQKEQIARGLYPYDSEGKLITDFNRLDDVRQRDYVYSRDEEEFSNEEVGRGNVLLRDPYGCFLREVEEFKIDFSDFESDLEFKKDSLIRNFPLKFAREGSQDLNARNYTDTQIGVIYDRMIRFAQFLGRRA